MTTKTIVIGSSEPTPPKLNPIKFVYFLNYISPERSGYSLDSWKREHTTEDNTPSHYKYVELICRNYVCAYDLMFAYNDPNDRQSGMLWAGFWNDGVAE